MRAASLTTSLPGRDVGVVNVTPPEAPSAAAREDVAMEAPAGSGASRGAGILLTQSLPLSAAGGGVAGQPEERGSLAAPLAAALQGAAAEGGAEPMDHTGEPVQIRGSGEGWASAS